MITKELLLQQLQIALSQLSQHREISIDASVDEVVIDLHDKLTHVFKCTLDIISEKTLSVNYLQQFNTDLNHTFQFLPYKDFTVEALRPNNKLIIKENIESQTIPLEKQVKLLEFNLDFFRKLNFFDNNVVAIGANGSGKTTLSNTLKKYLPNNGVVISAQKVLIIPTFSGVSNFNATSQKLLQSQTVDKTLKVTYSTENQGNSWTIMTELGGEFKVLLDNLLAERSVIRNQFCDGFEEGKKAQNVPVTKLDKALKIWNSLIQHRVLECKDGINITLRTISGTDSYPAHQMSDGEKVTLYLIAHVLQAPTSGFIIIDEPEMYLHKTILTKIWDILEQERQDSIFVYLTHDLDFATSRTTAKKIWIKSFTHPNSWEIDNIPDNDLPESLLLELLGSRKPILFCEGKKGSIDEKIYNILFPNFTITPVESCFSVMNYTKAFNKLPNATVKSIGLIDSDYHGAERLKVLEAEKIFSFSMAEPENIFFDENFLKIMAQQLLHSETVVNQIKSALFLSLKKEIELQVANYVSAKINYYFKDSHVSKGNSLADVNLNYSKFTGEIHVQEWYDKRFAEINEIIEKQDYQKALSIFNNKGLKSLGNNYFKITDFTDKALKILHFKPETHNILRKYFPNKIKTISI